METFWFAALAFMFAMYGVLDGFDLGAGIIHLRGARTNDERRTIFNAIGPVWDGNEVWLIASGGVLFFAFPKLYAASFSGFYLPLMIMLWLLMLRALAIEFRRHIANELWQTLWDFVFFGSSLLLAFFFGAALGNIVRGVPLKGGYFFEPLWTNFRVSPEPGILDWFTILFGLLSCSILAWHGANYIALKSWGNLYTRSRILAKYACLAGGFLSAAALLSTFWIHPEYFTKFSDRPWGFVFLLPAIFSPPLGLFFSWRGRDLLAFLCSSLFIFSSALATAFAMYPVVLPSSGDPSESLTAFNAAVSEYGLRIGLWWWIPGMALIIAYFIYLYYTFRGRIGAASRSTY